MYEYILDTKVATLLIATALACFAAVLVGNYRVALRSVIFSFGPSFACAFFVIGLFYDGRVSAFDLGAGFLFEFLVLLVFMKLFIDALRLGHGVDDRVLERWLRLSLVLQVLFALPIVTSTGFGIFSEGSRIAFLDNNSSAKFLVYVGVLNTSVQIGLISHRLSSGFSLGLTGYAIVVCNVALSTLAGSKGGFFLWLASILALIDYRCLRIRWMLVITGLIVVAVALVVTANIISESLNISNIEFAELAVARFFLNNDARALVFDVGRTSDQFSDLLASSFRALANLLGHGSHDPPLGFHLSSEYFGVTYTGPNSSLIALITYYSTPGYALLPAVIACLGLCFLYASVVGLRRMVCCPLRKKMITLIGLVLVQMMSQDFLGFQLLVPWVCLVGLIFIATDRKCSHALAR